MQKGSLIRFVTITAGTFSATVDSVSETGLVVNDEYGNDIAIQWSNINQFAVIDEESDEFKDFVCHQRMNKVNSEMCELADQVIKKLDELVKISPDLDVASMLSMLDDLVDSQLEERAN